MAFFKMAISMKNVAGKQLRYDVQQGIEQLDR
jgi:hypothetical protein